MSGFSGTCQICGEYDVMADVMGRTHRCKPAWRAIPADSGYEEEDATTVYASDAEDAAEAFMEKWDDGDISYGSDMDVIVWPRGEPDKKEKWNVTSEPAVVYSAFRSK